MLPPFSVVIPAFNEAARIGDTIQQTLAYLASVAPHGELIVINDGSTDVTSAVSRKALSGAKIENQLLENHPNRGKGAAVRRGLLAARKPIALFFDADLSTPLEEIPKVVEPIAKNEADVAFGSRALDRRLIGQHQPWGREQGGRLFNLVVRTATGLPFWDTQCGFKAFRMDVCRPILEGARTIGFAFDVELLLLAWQAGLRIKEIPVRWNHQPGSKVRFLHDSFRMLREIAALRRQTEPAGAHRVEHLREGRS
jgi:dolichyl-phosphate beta-glucosyltransferase